MARKCKPNKQVRSALRLVRSGQWKSKNDRRYELIVKKNREGLTKEEAAEFVRLHEEVYREVHEAYPDIRPVTERDVQAFGSRVLSKAM